jgi:DNA-binding response OmpR family regulator
VHRVVDANGWGGPAGTGTSIPAPLAGSVLVVHILLATDADWIVEAVTGALGGEDDTFTVCRDGRAVAGQVKEKTPDLAILDLQIGTMGGMAVTMDLRLDESAGVLPHVPVLMLLDRQADLHLARRSGAEGWLIKPLDSLRLRKAAIAILDGGTYTEGLPVEEVPEVSDDEADAERAADSSEEEPATAG